ncbi:MAG TPA: A/G-specific adenine glycosylase, partial [Flavobacterium sp.]|nr:A/G-specific adenine glycosylase [Flavobacterium sp.]
INQFPSVFDLANAPEEQVLKLWQGLGYYSRARNLHNTAKHVVTHYNGVFPKSYNQLLKLKGIGTYTAAAIASFSNQEPVAVLDGNVYRVLARYFNIQNDISASPTKKIFQELAQKVLPPEKASVHNQAIMEFGALQCVPKNPNCAVCVFSSSCGALQHKLVDKLPVKTKKTKVNNRFLSYLIFIDSQNKTLVNQRTEKGIWQNLYEFPLFETNIKATEQEIIAYINTLNYKVVDVSVLNLFTVIHKLSHQKLHIQFIEVKLEDILANAISITNLKKLPFPIVIHNFIERFFTK